MSEHGRTPEWVAGHGCCDSVRVHSVGATHHLCTKRIDFILTNCEAAGELAAEAADGCFVLRGILGGSSGLRSNGTRLCGSAFDTGRLIDGLSIMNSKGHGNSFILCTDFIGTATESTSYLGSAQNLFFGRLFAGEIQSWLWNLASFDPESGNEVADMKRVQLY
jgi:hypothetical protein